MARRLSPSPASTQAQEGALTRFSTWIEVNLDALEHNLGQIAAKSQGGIMPILKANAYGHGAPVIASFLKSKGYLLLGVSSLEEALTILEHVQVPLLVLTPPLPEQMPHYLRANLIPTVTSQVHIAEFSRLAKLWGKKVTVHLKVDTGLGRLGALPEAVDQLALEIKKTPWLRLGGVFSHFAAASEDSRFTREQLKVFLDLRSRIQAIYPGLLWHLANSAAFSWLPESHLDLARIGTLLYGQSPLPLGPSWSLQETWECKARLIDIRTLAKGTSIGYGREYHLRRPLTVGVVPLGYGQGLELEPQTSPGRLLRQAIGRGLKATNRIYQGDVALPILGRISMGLTSVDLSKKPHLKVGDEVQVAMRRVTASAELPRVYNWRGQELCVFWNRKIYQRGRVVTNLDALWLTESPLDHGFSLAAHNHSGQ